MERADPLLAAPSDPDTRMTTTRDTAGRVRGSTRTRVLLAINVLIALLIMLWLIDQLRPRMATDVRRDLLLDGARVELLEGFDDVTALDIWNDLEHFNPDRDEVAIPMRRDARLAWHVQAREGRFIARVARLVVGPGGDDSEALLTVHNAARPDVRVQVALPEAPPDPDAPAGLWREGPPAEVGLSLSGEVETLILQTSAPNGAPDGGAVALLSPRVIQQPVSRPAEGWPVTVEDETRLLALVPDDERDLVFARRTGPDSPDGASSEPTDVLVAPVEAAGSFSGEGERPAIAITGEAVLELTVDIGPDTALRGALALDERLPPRSSARLEVYLDNELVASEPVSETAWREIDVPLGEHVGTGRTLTLQLNDARLQPGSVERRDIDLVTGRIETVRYEAQQVRVGFAGARLSTPRDVTRRIASAEHPSVILIQVETLRADFLPPWGGMPWDLTPNLNRLAARGVTFDRAMTPSPWTVPTTASLMTGLTPSAHGAVDHDRMVLPGGVATLAERARAAGLATGAVVASDVLRPHAGFARGFDSYAHIPYSNARQVNHLAEAFLSNHVGQQFLLFLHTFDPHSPYNAPGDRRDRFVDDDLRHLTIAGAEGRIVAALIAVQQGRGEVPPMDDPDVRFLRQRYLGEIAWMDEQLGALLDVVERLGLDEDTIIVFTSDHGEEFLEHGLIGHGSNLHDESLWVPLIVTAPPGVEQAWPSGASVPSVAGTIGLYASVLDWMDVSFDAGAARPPLERPTGAAFSETDKGIAADGLGDPLRRFIASVRTDEHRYIHALPVKDEDGEGRRELFDLKADPLAQAPRLPDAPGLEAVGERLSRLLGKAMAWAKDHRARTALPGGGSEAFEALFETGYIGGGQDAPGPDDEEKEKDGDEGETPPGG
jgi:arylsulfatase A-like enzyme